MLRKPAFPADLKVYPTLTEPLKKLREQILFHFAHGTKREGMGSEDDEPSRLYLSQGFI